MKTIKSGNNFSTVVVFYISDNFLNFYILIIPRDS